MITVDPFLNLDRIFTESYRKYDSKEAHPRGILSGIIEIGAAMKSKSNKRTKSKFIQEPPFSTEKNLKRKQKKLLKKKIRPPKDGLLQKSEENFKTEFIREPEVEVTPEPSLQTKKNLKRKQKKLLKKKIRPPKDGLLQKLEKNSKTESTREPEVEVTPEPSLQTKKSLKRKQKKPLKKRVKPAKDGLLEKSEQNFKTEAIRKPEVEFTEEPPMGIKKKSSESRQEPSDIQCEVSENSFLNQVSESVRKYIKAAANDTSKGFRRIDVRDIDPSKLISNSYKHKPGQPNEYGFKAFKDLSSTRGKGFRNEKNKKKRGRYIGGKIDTNVYSTKLSYSDDE